MRLIRTYRKSVTLEVCTSFSLILATIGALLICNSKLSNLYTFVFDFIYITDGFTIHMFINDFLMAIFFLVAGLEIKHELIFGSLSSLKKASFPVIASLGGVIVPALIFLFFNINTPFLNGICIPISTDIAFAVGVFFIFKNKFHPSLKVFLLSLAVVDDLISIIAIGLVYSIDINYLYLSIAICILITLLIANKIFRIQSITYYLLSGFCLWYFIHLSGVHATISGILLAIVIPTKSDYGGVSCLERLQRVLVPINSIIIIPLFAFANTGISLNISNSNFSNAQPLCLGIILGLCVGKPLGIMLFSYISCKFKLTEKPSNISWIAIFLISLIAGIGFTMSIFVSEIAFIHNLVLVDIAKICILISSTISIALSFICITVYSLLIKKRGSCLNHITNKYYIS